MVMTLAMWISYTGDEAGHVDGAVLDESVENATVMKLVMWISCTCDEAIHVDHSAVNNSMEQASWHTAGRLWLIIP